MAGPRVVVRARPRTDWWTFGFFALASVAVAVALGYGLAADERRSSRARAEHIARTYAEHLAQAAATPGTDFAGILPGLANAAGPGTTIAIVEVPDDDPFAYDKRLRISAHDDPARPGTWLDSKKSRDRGTMALARRTLRYDPRAGAIIEWRGDVVAAGARAAGSNRPVAVVEGVEPRPVSARPVATAAFVGLLLVLLGAGLHDVLTRIGRYVNALLLVAVTSAAGLLARALAESEWRGDPTSALVRRAQGLKLPELARALSLDLPAQPSWIERWGVWVAAFALGFYLLGLAGLWHALGRVARRHADAYAAAAPSFVLLALGALAPVVALAAIVSTGARVFGVDVVASAIPVSFQSAAVDAAVVLIRGLSVAFVALVAGVALTALLEEIPRRRAAQVLVLLLVPAVTPGVVAAAMPASVRAWAGSDTALRDVWLFAPLVALALHAMRSRHQDLVDASMVEGLGARAAWAARLRRARPLLAGLGAWLVARRVAATVVPVVDEAPNLATLVELAAAAAPAAFATWLLALPLGRGFDRLAELQARWPLHAISDVRPVVRWRRIVAGLLLAFVVLAALAPVAWAVGAGLATSSDPARVWQLDETGLAMALARSFLLCATAATVATAVGTGAAWALTRAPFPLRSTLVWALAAAWLLPGAAASLSAPWIAARLGRGTSGVFALALASAAALPVAAWLLRARFSRVGEAAELAAKMEGLRPGATLRARVLPDARRARRAAFAASFASAWAAGWVPASAGLGDWFAHAAPPQDPGAIGWWALAVLVPALVSGLAVLRSGASAVASAQRRGPEGEMARA